MYAEDFGLRYSNLSGLVVCEMGAHQTSDPFQIWCGGFVPGHAQVVHGQYRPDFSNLLVGLFGSDEIIDGEKDGRQVSDLLVSNLHGTPKPCVESGRDPCGPKVGSAVEVRQRFGGLEANDFGKIAADIEPHEGEDDRLPRSKTL